MGILHAEFILVCYWQGETALRNIPTQKSMAYIPTGINLGYFLQWGKNCLNYFYISSNFFNLIFSSTPLLSGVNLQISVAMIHKL